MNAMVRQEYLRRPGIFGCDEVDATENCQCADCEIIRMSDGQADEEESARWLAGMRAHSLTLFFRHRYNFQFQKRVTLR